MKAAIRTIRSHVSVVDRGLREPVVVFRDEGDPFDRSMFLSEIMERARLYGGEGWCGEGESYRHVYVCDASVPADIADALGKRRAA